VPPLVSESTSGLSRVHSRAESTAESTAVSTAESAADRRVAGRLNTGDKTRNLSLKEITDTKGPVPIQFKLRDKQTVMPLGDHVAHWSSYIGKVIRGVPLYYPSWLKVPKERKAALITDIGTQFDLKPHMESLDWTEINTGIQNIASAAQNRQNRAKSTVISRQGSRSLARLRDEMEYPSLIDAFFVAHTVNGEFLGDEDREEMMRLEDMGTYTDDEINRLARGRKQRGHIVGVGRVLPARATASPTRVAGAGTRRSVPTIRTTRMRMAILSCVIYGRKCVTVALNSRLENTWDPPFRRRLSLGKESLTSLPQRRFPDDKSPGKAIPSDKSPGKPQIVAGESC
nr:hypothetical protein [Tanacetum cinerariifolium]